MKASNLLANRISQLCAQPRIFGVSGANIEDIIEALLAEPSEWEQLQLGDQPARQVRFTTKGPVVKSLRLLDRRVEQDYPAYALEVLLAHGETFSAGTEVEFTLIIDLNPL